MKIPTTIVLMIIIIDVTFTTLTFTFTTTPTTTTNRTKFDTRLSRLFNTADYRLRCDPQMSDAKMELLLQVMFYLDVTRGMDERCSMLKWKDNIQGRIGEIKDHHIPHIYALICHYMYPGVPVHILQRDSIFNVKFFQEFSKIFQKLLLEQEMRKKMNKKKDLQADRYHNPHVHALEYLLSASSSSSSSPNDSDIDSDIDSRKIIENTETRTYVEEQTLMKIDQLKSIDYFAIKSPIAHALCATSPPKIVVGGGTKGRHLDISTLPTNIKEQFINAFLIHVAGVLKETLLFSSSPQPSQSQLQLQQNQNQYFQYKICEKLRQFNIDTDTADIKTNANFINRSIKNVKILDDNKKKWIQWRKKSSLATKGLTLAMATILTLVMYRNLNHNNTIMMSSSHFEDKTTINSPKNIILTFVGNLGGGGNGSRRKIFNITTNIGGIGDGSSPWTMMIIAAIISMIAGIVYYYFCGRNNNGGGSASTNDDSGYSITSMSTRRHRRLSITGSCATGNRSQTSAAVTTTAGTTIPTITGVSTLSNNKKSKLDHQPRAVLSNSVASVAGPSSSGVTGLVAGPSSGGTTTTLTNVNKDKLPQPQQPQPQPPQQKGGECAKDNKKLIRSASSLSSGARARTGTGAGAGTGTSTQQTTTSNIIKDDDKRKKRTSTF